MVYGQDGYPSYDGNGIDTDSAENSLTQTDGDGGINPWKTLALSKV